MNKALVPVTAGVEALASMSDVEFAARLKLMQQGAERARQVQLNAMIRDVDYGLVPGTDKPTLYKSGAEKLCMLYGLVRTAETILTETDGTTTPAIRYEATVRLHVGNETGPVVGTGVGVCHSWEKKYLWSKGDVQKAWDLANTIKKMSVKRAYVDATLTATATSGLFTQDVADDDEDPTKQPGPVEWIGTVTAKEGDLVYHADEGPYGSQEPWYTFRLKTDHFMANVVVPESVFELEQLAPGLRVWVTGTLEMVPWEKEGRKMPPYRRVEAAAISLDTQDDATVDAAVANHVEEQEARAAEIREAAEQEEEDRTADDPSDEPEDTGTSGEADEQRDRDDGK